MSHIQLSHPWMLLLALVPVILLALQWQMPLKARHAVLFSCYDLVPARRRSPSAISRVVLLLRWLAMLSLVPIAAGLDWKDTTVDKEKVSALMIVLDVSSSMTADDFEPGGRLEEAKKHLQQLVAGAPVGELGIIVFAAAPRLVVPVTRDYESVRKALAEIQAVGFGQDGTAIGTALASAANRLRHVDGQRREILLLTDGVNNSGAIAPLDAARLARALGIKINAIGVGGDSPSHYWVPTAEGAPYRMEAKIEIDERTLEDAVLETGGSYTRVKDSRALSRALLSFGGKLQPAAIWNTPLARLDLVHILAFVALTCICLTVVVANFIRPELPE